MSLEIFSSLAIICYGLSTFGQWLRIKGRAIGKGPIQLLVLLGMVAQTVSIYLVVFQPGGINLNFFAAGSLSSWLVVLILLLSSIRKPVDNLLVVLLPVAIAAVASSTLIPVKPTVLMNRTPGMVGHILISILAYSTLTVAAFQAVLLAYQESLLKRHHPNGIIRAFPPMQTMEKLLFEYLWAGLLLLTLGLGSGFLFLQDIFAQQVAHKTVLSVIAWLLFAILLCGRTRLGWRGQTAIRWTLGGFLLLMLAFFGSKFIMDMVIN